MECAFTALFAQDEEWWLGWSPEARGAYAQERTLNDARESLIQAIQLVLEHDPIRRDAEPLGQAVDEERILVELR